MTGWGYRVHNARQRQDRANGGHADAQFLRIKGRDIDIDRHSKHRHRQGGDAISDIGSQAQPLMACAARAITGGNRQG